MRWGIDLSMDALQLVVTFLATILGTGGFVAVWMKSRSERERLRVEADQQRQTVQVQGDEDRESAMAAAVVEMARESNQAIIALVSELVKGTNTNFIQMATSFEGFKTESAHQVRYLREAVEHNTGALGKYGAEVEELNSRLGIVVDHLTRQPEGTADIDDRTA